MGEDGGLLLVRLPDADTSGQCRLSPYDLSCKGRSTPMLWFYDTVLDVEKLTAALEAVLAKGYAVLCGRYAAPETEGGTPLAVDLNNKGVVLYLGTATVDTPHLPPYTEQPLSSAIQTQGYNTSAQTQWLPPKEPMDPDKGNPEAPILALKVTTISGACSGTAIGMLVQHGVVDADSMIVFMKNWAECYRGQETLSVPPSHDRRVEQWQLHGAECPPKPDAFRIRAVPAGEAPLPEFVPVMPRIMGPQVCVLPIDKTTLSTWKNEAQRATGTEDFLFSQDDVLTARVWRALARTRCEQLEISCDSDEVTTCSRASNFRQRCSPALDEGYCANGVCQVWTQMSVKELLREDESMVAAVAKTLRTDLSAHTSEVVKQRAQWLSWQQRQGCRTIQMFDANALTFILSSWMFDWEGADFNARPVGYDHAAHTPIVAVFVPRKGVGEGKLSGGVNVYTCGTEAAVKRFSELLLSK